MHDNILLSFTLILIRTIQLTIELDIEKLKKDSDSVADFNELISGLSKYYTTDM